MAGRGPRTGGGRRTREDARAERSTRGAAPAVDDLDDTAPARVRDLDESLVRIRDLAGRPRGTGFVADHHGTVITSHEAVDGLPRLVLHAAA